MDILLSPPIAFLIYIPLVLLIMWLGQTIGRAEQSEKPKRSIYGSRRRRLPPNCRCPGYRPFFLIAFFFAILHLGMLVLG